MAEAELLVAQDEIDEAILKISEAIAELPEPVELVRYLAILLDQKGDQKKCEASIKDALERIGTPIAQRKLGLLLAQFYTRWEQKDNAYMLLNTLARKLHEDIPLKRRLLLCEQVINDPTQAQQIVDDIKTIEGQDG